MSGGGENMECVSLEQLKWGETGVVEEIRLEGPVRRRLIEMGLTPGVRVTVRGRAPLGDPIRARLRGYSLTLRAEDARGVMVRRERA